MPSFLIIIKNTHCHSDRVCVHIAIALCSSLFIKDRRSLQAKPWQTVVSQILISQYIPIVSKLLVQISFQKDFLDAIWP